MVELKRCPFCGSNGNVYPKGTRWYAGCGNRNNYDADACYLVLDDAFETETEAVEVWNRRVDV